MPHQRIRAFNKRITNRITSRFANTSHGPFAILRHVGRRSGKAYETPIMVKESGDHFAIALTYGPEVDWYQNVVAAGHASLLWHGRVYTLEKPEPLAQQSALALFSPFQRIVLRRLGTQHFVSLKFHEVDQSSSPSASGPTP